MITEKNLESHTTGQSTFPIHARSRESAEVAPAVATKFVVFTTNRSGSVWVMSTLNSFPNVTAQGELFLPRPRSVERRWDSDFACPRFIETKPEGSSMRPFSTFTYLDNLYETPGSVGFKLMYAQLGRYPEILMYFMRQGIRVVHLVRQNHLDVLISYALKAKLGQAHLLSGQSAPTELRVALDTKDLVQRMTKLARKQQLARTLLQWSRLPHIEVAYEDLLQDQAHFYRMFSFLSISATEHMPPSTVAKIRSGGHRESLSNYGEVQEELMDTRFIGLLQ